MYITVYDKSMQYNICYYTDRATEKKTNVIGGKYITKNDQTMNNVTRLSKENSDVVPICVRSFRR